MASGDREPGGGQQQDRDDEQHRLRHPGDHQGVRSGRESVRQGHPLTRAARGIRLGLMQPKTSESKGTRVIVRERCPESSIWWTQGCVGSGHRSHMSRDIVPIL
jgi:hypothetical protein